MESDLNRWDTRFKGKSFALGKEPNPFLKKYLRFLPKGRTLDIASGEGRNAVFLARHGFDVDAIDISERGLKKTRRLAREIKVRVHTIQADLDRHLIEEGQYNLIVNFYFLRRSLIPSLKRGLRQGGKIIFETYTLEHRTLGAEGPKQARYFLKPNELLRLFKNFHVLFYREGIFREGGRKKAVASLIAEKP
jgi:tellurite methyltransferase